MTDNTKVLNLLGLAYKAKKVINGEENVIFALKSGKCKIVFVANDSSLKTTDRIDKKCFFYNTMINRDFSTDELSWAIGRPLVKILALTDQGFYEALVKILKWGVFLWKLKKY